MDLSSRVGVRGLLVAAIGLVLGASCSAPAGDDRSTPSPSLTEAQSQASSPSPGAAESPRPAADSLTLVVGPDSVAGWWDGTRWVMADGTEPVPASGGETYSVVGLSGSVQTATGSAPEEGCEIIPGTSLIEVPGLERSFNDPLEEWAIAVHGVPDPLPRTAEVLPPSAPYAEAARPLLAERGIEDSSPEVVQILRVDLDGDGRDEVAVVAERIADQQGLLAQSGDYSIVFVRSLVDEQVVTSVIADTVADPDPGETPFVESHRVSALADLNGDGRMELAVASKYYEGAGVGFFELGDDGRVERILSSGCGA